MNAPETERMMRAGRFLARDRGVVIGYALFGALYVVLEYQRIPVSTAPPIGVTAGAALAASSGLWWWRRRPVIAVTITVLAYGAFVLAALPAASVAGNAVLIALYGAGAYLLPRRAKLVRGAAIVVLVGYVVTHLVVRGGASDALGLAILIGNALLLNAFIWGAVWLIGDGARSRRAYEAELVQRTRELRAEREISARRAVAEERLRIARELHDVVAHHISVIGIQAAAARRALARQPAAAGAALEAIEAASRRGIADTQRLLGMLRREDGDAEEAASLADLQALLSDLRAGGLAVRLHIAGRAFDDLPPALSQTAYRIVQEALTNVVKHAGPAEVDLSVVRDDVGLEIAVRDNGVGPAETSSGGRGLIGMRERVALFGGELAAGGQRGRGYSVRARLPVEAS
jgi:signal transduction histidine kinase